MPSLNLLPKTQPPTPEPDRSRFFSGLVTLYLVMLAFFILLNSVATVEVERKKKTIGSLRETFSDYGISEIANIGFIENAADKTSNKNNYFAPIGNLARDVLQLTETEVTDENQMQMKVPASTFFDDDATEISKKEKDFLTQLATQLSELGSGTRIEAEFIFPNNEKNIYRVGSMARTLVDLGVPENNIIVGTVLDSSEQDSITINFYRRDVGEKLRVGN